ncbi:MAG: BMP family ABC transporter substrate-binding protein, partial [Anaerolineaceae bacterium]|nr:BMP family ABC transporter substrate-binding protein [Anaerolineaceae bacterium]
MYKKVTLLLAILVMASILISACQPAAAPVEAKLKVCQVTDTGGIDDKSFNATA